MPDLVRRNLRAIFGDGVAFSLMVGLGETYIPAFVLALGMSEVLAGLKDHTAAVANFPVQPPALAGLLREIEAGTISGKMGKEIFAVMCASGEEAGEIIRKRGLRQLSDPGQIEGVVEQVLTAHPREVGQYRAGQKKVLGFLIGRVMAATEGKANPQMVNQILHAKLGE